MREKTKKVVITFHTTAEAIAMEKSCKENEISGRLIPVPRQISSGCGLAFCAPIGDRELILEFMNLKGLSSEAVSECLL